MKILWGHDSGDTARHAKNLIRAIQRYQDKQVTEPKPKDVPNHMAQHPLICDDCGETYWSRDQWGSHITCKGVKKEIGF